MNSVTSVRARDDFHLELLFADGEHRLFDMTPYLTKGVFTELQAPALFKQAYVGLGTVCWPGNLDIAPETLFDRSVEFGVTTTAR